MSVVKELLRAEENGKISFGNYELRAQRKDSTDCAKSELFGSSANLRIVLGIEPRIDSTPHF